MAEKKLVFPKKVIVYNGIFNMKELYNFIDSWFAQKGYDKSEDKNIMQVTAQGKYVYLDLKPNKTLSDYAKSIIRVELSSEGYKDITIKKNDLDVDMHQGKVTINVYGFLQTDLEGRYESRPLFFILKMLFEKFIFTGFHSKFAGIVKSDCFEFISELKTFLNLYRL